MGSCAPKSRVDASSTAAASSGSPPASSADWQQARVELEAVFDTEGDPSGRKQFIEAECCDAEDRHPENEGQQLARLLQESHCILSLDAANRQKLEGIVKRIGWPSQQLVGRKASAAAFLVIWHAELGMQERYLPALRQAVAQQQAEPSLLALLEDRVSIREGKAQVYGSRSLIQDAGVTLQPPVTDPAHLDERRAAVGLPPICDYLRGLNEGHVVWPSCVADGGVGAHAPAQ